MASDILSFPGNQSSGSPFDSIRQVDEDGKEFWSGRDLQVLLGYTQWRNFNDSIEKAKISCKVNGHKVFDHFADAGKMVQLGSGSSRRLVDFHLSRYACHLVAMNGDPRKPEIAAAQSYFAIQTHRAETVIPAISEDLRRLQLENDNMRLKLLLCGMAALEERATA